jgi:NADH-quinone oxidoreductase subunit A
VGQYLPVLVMLVLATAFAAISLLMSKLLSPKNANAAKSAPYECGIVSTTEPPERFPVTFYLVAMLFIMFDIEVVFIYPYAVAHEQLGGAGFAAIISFSVVFFAAFVYVVARGGLDWGPARAYRRALEGAVSVERSTTSTVRRVGLEGREEAAA